MEPNSDRDSEANRQDYLVQLWSAQLNQPDVGVSDDFFAAGGSSMQMIEMLMAVSDKYGKEIDYAAFFQEPCIRKLNELLTN